MSGQSVNGASSLPEELLIAAASDVSNSSIGQGLAHQFNLNAAGAEFQTVLNGIPSEDVQSLLEGGQAISVTDGSASNSTVSSEPELVDAGNGLSVPLMQNLEQEKNIDVVPVNATIEIRTAHDDLTFVLPTQQPPAPLVPDVGGGGGGPPVVAADFFFDGTGNDGGPDSQGPNATDDNVWKMYSADKLSQFVTYKYGVGTNDVPGTNGIGKATGLGAAALVQEAWDALLIDIAQGANTIDIVGFSRGAAEALEFLNRIADAITQNKIQELNSDGEKVYLPNGAPEYVGVPELHVRFVGLYDTVSTFAGVPGYTNGWRISIPTSISIQQIVHAVALSEHRAQFPWTNLAQPGVQNLLQEGFTGAHADIGGGYSPAENPNGPNGQDGLSNITLHWMMYWAKQTGWNFANYYTNLVDDYDDAQVHYSYNGTGFVDGLEYSLSPPVNRDFGTTLQAWEPDLAHNSPAGDPVAVYFNDSIREDWDPFWQMPDKAGQDEIDKMEAMSQMF